MAKQQISPIILKLVNAYFDVVAKTIPVDRMIVFGSYAKGKNKPWSDIDVAVVSRRLGRDPHTERVMLSGLVDSIDLRIEPHPFSPEDFADPWDPLAAEIRRHGVRVA